VSNNKPHTVSQVMWELMSAEQQQSIMYQELIARLTSRKDLMKPDHRTRTLVVKPIEPKPQLDNPNTWSIATLNNPTYEYLDSPQALAHRIHVCMLDTFFALNDVDDEVSRARARLSLSEALYLYEGKEFKGELYE